MKLAPNFLEEVRVRVGLEAGPKGLAKGAIIAALPQIPKVAICRIGCVARLKEFCAQADWTSSLRLSS